MILTGMDIGARQCRPMRKGAPVQSLGKADSMARQQFHIYCEKFGKCQRVTTTLAVDTDNYGCGRAPNASLNPLAPAAGRSSALCSRAS